MMSIFPAWEHCLSEIRTTGSDAAGFTVDTECLNHIAFPADFTRKYDKQRWLLLAHRQETPVLYFSGEVPVVQSDL
jgi:hypothetical protein